MHNWGVRSIIYPLSFFPNTVCFNALSLVCLSDLSIVYLKNITIYFFLGLWNIRLDRKQLFHKRSSKRGQEKREKGWQIYQDLLYACRHKIYRLFVLAMYCKCQRYRCWSQERNAIAVARSNPCVECRIQVMMMRAWPSASGVCGGPGPADRGGGDASLTLAVGAHVAAPKPRSAWHVSQGAWGSVRLGFGPPRSRRRIRR